MNIFHTRKVNGDQDFLYVYTEFHLLNLLTKMLYKFWKLLRNLMAFFLCSFKSWQPWSPHAKKKKFGTTWRWNNNYNNSTGWTIPEHFRIKTLPSISGGGSTESQYLSKSTNTQINIYFSKSRGNTMTTILK